jgi:hypothetical protein
MRQVLLGDIVAAARAVLDLPPSEQAVAVSTMMDRAHIADKIMKRTGLPHRQWGNGSLMAAAGPRPQKPEPFLSDLDYLAALRLILQALATWKQNQRRSIRRQGG